MICDACDRRQHFRCGGKCGCALCPIENRRDVSVTPRQHRQQAPRRRVYVPTGRGVGCPLGAMRGVSSETQAEIAAVICTAIELGHWGSVPGLTKRQVAAAFDVTYEQVRTIERHLKVLAA